MDASSTALKEQIQFYPAITVKIGVSNIVPSVLFPSLCFRRPCLLPKLVHYTRLSHLIPAPPLTAGRDFFGLLLFRNDMLDAHVYGIESWVQ